jgi:hypothetical protein
MADEGFLHPGTGVISKEKTLMLMRRDYSQNGSRMPRSFT